MSGHDRDMAVVRLSAQHAVARVLAESVTLAEATPALLEAMAESLGWTVGSIWEVDPEANVLRLVEQWHSPDVEPAAFAEASLAMTFPRGVGLPGRVWEQGRLVWIPDAPRDLLFPRARAAAADGLRAAVGFPIRGGRDQVLGVIEFLADELRAPDEELITLLNTFGRQIGQFVVRKRTEEAARRSEALKAAMFSASLDAVISMDHRGQVQEWNPAAERTFGYGRDEVVGREMASLIIPPSLRGHHRTALAHYVATGEGPILDQRLELTGMRRDGSEFPVELTVTRIPDTEPPLFTGFVRDLTQRKRAEAEVERALERERLARLRAEELERRSTYIAETLQRSLLPPHLPEIPSIDSAARFRSAVRGIEVGGDFYDLFERGSGDWSVVIGDVCGKGAKAAALTALVRFTIRAAAMREESPSGSLRVVNDVLRREGRGSEFCTIAYASLHPRRDGGTAGCLAVGGHPLPFVLRADGGVEPVGAAGTLIGVIPDPLLTDVSFTLAPGDALVLYTDGITETRTPSGLFGSGRLAALLESCRSLDADGIAGRVEHEVLDTPEHRARDDVAIVVLRARR